MDDLLVERQSEYGDTWRLHGEVVNPLAFHISNLIVTAPQYYLPWTMILNKLIRILFSPHKKDNWADIVGYAQLVLVYMEKIDEESRHANST